MKANAICIMIVEDDPAVRNLMTTTMETQHYRFCSARTGEEALAKAVSQKPDIILLDLGLPDIDGIAIIKKIRSWSGAPIIVISARSEDQDKIEALDAGADDYLTKPFSVDELLARLRATVRRIGESRKAKDQDQAVFVNGDLKIDYAAGTVYLRGKELHVTPIEYKLLVLFSHNPGKVLTHTFITKEVWGSNWEGDVASLRVYMATLRKKIEKDPASPQVIQTHVGVGYRMMQSNTST
ncbi:MAG: response regulator transcription factor [Eubacteriaceae bacterium]|nr:response regulator transcription factor [Eubacteriaceae bacterium]MDD4508226.1 response regulator transcription factor [Eubacteriaceae bacterium]